MMAHGVPGQKQGEVRGVRVDQGIRVNIDIPIVAHLLGQFVDLELLIGDGPFRELPLLDDMDVGADLVSVPLQEGKGDGGHLGGMIVNIEGVDGLFGIFLPHTPSFRGKKELIENFEYSGRLLGVIFSKQVFYQARLAG